MLVHEFRQLLVDPGKGPVEGSGGEPPGGSCVRLPRRQGRPVRPQTHGGGCGGRQGSLVLGHGQGQRGLGRGLVVHDLRRDGRQGRDHLGQGVRLGGRDRLLPRVHRMGEGEGKSPAGPRGGGPEWGPVERDPLRLLSGRDGVLWIASIRPFADRVNQAIPGSGSSDLACDNSSWTSMRHGVPFQSAKCVNG